MYNIDTLTVCETSDPQISRMTITLRSKDRVSVDKVVKQIEKIVEVISAKCVDEDMSFVREVALIKINISRERLNELDKTFSLEILKEIIDGYIIQVSGTISEIDEFIKEIGTENISEMARSGATAIEIK